jgi:LPS-assembly lipoprotein
MKTFITLLLALSISACGWHLRGSAQGGDRLAMSQPLDLSITAKDNFTPLTNELRRQLATFRITEVDNAPTVLELGTERMDRRTAGVGSDALTSAYEIVLTVDYQIVQQGVNLTPMNTQTSLARSYDYDVNNASSATREEELVLSEMRKELAQTILRRVKNLSARSLAPVSTDLSPADASDAQVTP